MKRTYALKYRRRREGKTNYPKRLKLLVSRRLRLVVRRTNTRIIAQIVEYQPKGDKILVEASASDLHKSGWLGSAKSIPAGYLIGLLLAKKALKTVSGKSLIVDLGLIRSIKGSRVYACVKGVIDGGVKVDCAEEMFPSEERLNGKHIESYGTEHKERFSGYAKNKLDVSAFSKAVEAIKKKI